MSDFKPVIDIKIMGVESRRENIERMKAHLGLSYSDVIIDDRSPNGAKDAWYNARRLWLSPMKSGATHRILLQDDIEFCDRFVDIVQRCIKRDCNAFWSLFNMPSIRYKMLFPESPYAIDSMPYTAGPGLIVPVKYIYHLVEWTDKVCGPYIPNDDFRSGLFAAYYNIPCMRLTFSPVRCFKMVSVAGSGKHWEANTFVKKIPVFDWSSNRLNIAYGHGHYLPTRSWYKLSNGEQRETMKLAFAFAKERIRENSYRIAKACNADVSEKGEGQ